MKITGYKIVTADNKGDLATAVNEEIKDGWQPFGSLVSDSTSDQTVLHQPLVTYEKSDS